MIFSPKLLIQASPCIDDFVLARCAAYKPAARRAEASRLRGAYCDGSREIVAEGAQ